MGDGIDILHFGLDARTASRLSERAGASGFRFDEAESAAWCPQRLEDGDYDVFLLGCPRPGGGVEKPAFEPAADLAEEAMRRDPRLCVVAVSAEPSYRQATRLARLGVMDYLPQGDDIDLLVEEIEASLRRVAASGDRGGAGRPSAAADLPDLVGRSKAIRNVARLVRLIAPRRSTVLISGRTGTGKELVARAIHQASPRAGGPLTAVNCGAIPENLIEAEFFGHVKGAFTGAVGNHAGRFEQANGGTIFLDEIGEMPLEMQSKLLRVLQEREVQRIGGSETVRVDVRVVAATNRDLKEMVRRGEFREDLYYRLNVVPIGLPSLAERAEDIPLLVDHLLTKVCRAEGVARKRAAPETMSRLKVHDWPGNVRQLENAVEKAVALSGDREVLYPSDFPMPRREHGLEPGRGLLIRLPAAGLDFEDVVDRIEHSLLEQALERSRGNKKQAADLLGIKRTTFAAKWKSLQAVEQSA